ncbi:MAG: signal peptidase II [Oscillospiraceae bacterium]
MTVTLSLAVAVALFVCDQLIKQWAVASLAPVGSIQVIPEFLRLTYVENYGAAFGIFQGQRLLLSLVTLAILVAGIWLLVSGKLHHGIERVCVSLILAGGAGNLCDRLLRGFVVDYLDINELFVYPMFNLADCCVVVGAVLMIFAVLLPDLKRNRHPNGEN